MYAGYAAATGCDAARPTRAHEPIDDSCMAKLRRDVQRRRTCTLQPNTWRATRHVAYDIRHAMRGKAVGAKGGTQRAPLTAELRSSVRPHCRAKQCSALLRILCDRSPSQRCATARGCHSSDTVSPDGRCVALLYGAIIRLPHRFDRIGSNRFLRRRSGAYRANPRPFGRPLRTIGGSYRRVPRRRSRDGLQRIEEQVMYLYITC